MTGPRAVSRIAHGAVLLALGAVAALYHLRTIDRTLELLDTGMIVHPIWRASLGEWPFVDFHNIYGPSVYWVNGLLFRLFAPDLQVLRLALVALKAVLAVEVYVLARRVAPPALALLSAALLVAVWGTPIWLFTAPYATYYATPLCLAALILLAGGRRSPGRLLLAGALVGGAATFKQTQGLFAFLSIALATLAAGSARGRALPAGMAGVLRLLVFAGVAVVAWGYVGALRAAPGSLLLCAPLVLACAALAWRDVRTWPPGRPATGAVSAVVVLGAGMALPLGACAAVFAARGALGALVFDTLAGLPQAMSWFVPLRAPLVQTTGLAGLVLGSFALVAGWGRRATRRDRAAAALLAGGVAAIVLGGCLLTARDGLAAYVRAARLPQEFFLVMPVLPLLLLAAAASAIVRQPAGDERDDAMLVSLFAAGSYLQMYPCADLPHAMMGLPAMLPVLAWVLGRVRMQTPAGTTVRTAATALAFVWPLVVAVPYVRNWLAVDRVAPDAGIRFPRATGIVPTTRTAADTAEVVRTVAAAAHGRSALALSDDRMLYFLADVPPALPADEFVLYLVGTGLIHDPEARALTDEDGMIRTLAARRPIVVEDTASGTTAGFRRVFPAAAAFLERTYDPGRAIGTYRVREPR